MATVDLVSFLQRELTSIGIALTPSKTVALPPKEHVPTLEEVALLEGVDVRIAERGGAMVDGVPIGTDVPGIRDGERDGVRRKRWSGTTREDAAAHARKQSANSHWLHGTANSLHRASDGPGVIPACMPKGRQQRDVNVGKPT